jgi:integrase
MDVTSKTLRQFGESLADRGLTEGTVRLYRVLVNACAKDDRGMTARLVDDDLAAKTRRSNRAALLAWADFCDDDILAKKVRRIRLPPAVRAKPKFPLEHAEWRQLVHAIRIDQTLDREPAVRAALLLVALRGLRMADALRVRKVDVTHALRTGRFAFYSKGQRRQDYDAAPVKEALLLLSQARGSWTTVEDLLVGRGCKSSGVARRHAAYTKMARALERIAKKEKIRDVHGHRFRRTYATEFLKRLGNDPNALVKLMMHVGWTNIATASSYVDAVNREELDRIGAGVTKEIME